MMAIAANPLPFILAWTPGWWEVVLILVVVLLLFGGAKLPELARGLGKGLRSFKEELHGVKSDLEEPPDSGTSKQDANAKADDDAQPSQGEKDDANGKPPA